MGKVLILESDAEWRSIFRFAIKHGEIPDATLVSTTEEAIAVLGKGETEVFRTNYIDESHGLKGAIDHGILYSAPAIKEALRLGVKVEVGTVNLQELVFRYIREQGMAIENIRVVPKTKSGGRLTFPGEGFYSQKNRERV